MDPDEAEEFKAFMQDIEKIKKPHELSITRDPGESYISQYATFKDRDRLVAEYGFSNTSSTTIAGNKELERFSLRQRMMNMTDDEKAMMNLDIAMEDLEISRSVRGCIAGMLNKDVLKAYRNPVLYAIVGEHVCTTKTKEISPAIIKKIQNRKIHGKSACKPKKGDVCACEDILRYLRLMMR